MPYFLSTENRRSAFEEDAKWRAKAICRLVALVFALAATALFSSAIGITNANFVNTMGAGDWTDGIALAPVRFPPSFPLPTHYKLTSSRLQILFSLLFNAGMLGAQFLLRQGRPVHPAVPVAGDLLAWAAAVPTLVYAIAGGLFWYWQGDGGIPADDGTLDCALFFNVWTPACNPLAYTVGRLEIAGAVFLFLLL